MAIGAGGAPTVDGNGLGGLVAGATLAAVRRSVGLDQATLAERLEVSVKTVQAWEQARNSMTRLPYARLRQIGRTLLAAGAA
ncbi:helix-turn-helix domain-containing protein, partial [Nocardia fluminea]|uniref:helix-turn-helix domain-containing protein n=1 Tax=Nocardia fluminea TaxID=134984 RepID=UPI00365820F6